MNPALIAALIGAGLGAGKTALNKKTRKNPGAYVSNVLGGAAAGYTGGSPGVLTGQISMDDSMNFNPYMMAGADAEGPPPAEPEPQPEPGQKRKPPGKTAGIMMDLLKAYMSRPARIPQDLPRIDAPSPLAMNPIYAAPRAPLPYPETSPIYRR